jgi:PAS domain S-box-containing protein
VSQNLPGRILDRIAEDKSLADIFEMPANLANLNLLCIKQALDSGEVQSYECELLLPEGRQNFEVRLVASGPHELLAMVRNITQRKQMESSLQASEARYRAIVEDQPDLVCRFLPDGTLTFVNSAYCHYIGKSLEQIVGVQFFEHTPIEEHQDIKIFLASFTPDHAVAVYENRMIARGGDIRWLQWTDRALFDRQGNLTEFQSTGRDITEQKQAEEALKKSEANLRAIFEHSLQPFILIDQEYRVRAFNRTAGRAIELTLGKIIWEGCSIDEFAPEEEIAEFKQYFERVVQGEVVKVERPLNLDGSDHWYEFNYSPVFTKDQQFVGVCFTAVDIDERKRAVETLTASERRLVAEMQSVLFTTAALVSDINLNNLLDFITTQARNLTGTDGAAILIFLYDDQQELEVVYSNKIKTGSRLPLVNSLVDQAITNHQTYVSNRAPDDPRTTPIRLLLYPNQVQSVLCVPLEIRGKTWGY